MSLVDKSTPETRTWKDPGWDPTGLVRQQVACLHDGVCPKGALKIPSPASPSENLGGIIWRPEVPNPEFDVIAPGLRVAAGRISGMTVKLGDVSMTVGDLPRGDASIALVALDGLPLATSKEMLLVAAARVENSGMQWNDTRTGLVSWGHGPALAEYVPLTITLPWPNARAERLDPTGAIAAPLAVEEAAGKSILHLAHEPSLWFLLHR
jgi:hypothetical protein